jgi:hypothetical protein
MSGNFADDFNWQKAFVPEVMGIIGPRLLKPAPWRVDARQAGDLIVVRTGDNHTIAMRLRRPGRFYFRIFWDEITIRSHRKSGAETELSKIIKGFGDWFFYGHVERKLSDDAQDH